jgi:hypothetical protein
MYIYKFYAKRMDLDNSKAEIVPLQNYEKFLGREEIEIPLLKSYEEYNCFEIIYDASTLLVYELRGINTEEIRIDLIKHANDINKHTYQEMSQFRKGLEEEKISKLIIQDVIDRILIFGEDFSLELNQLLKQYPITVEYVKGTNKEGKEEGVRFIRKVEKLQKQLQIVK